LIRYEYNSMLKINLPFTILALFSILFIPTSHFAQENNHTAREEAEGKIIWQKLQNKQISCNQISDGDFGALGEYFMGQMIGNSHKTMNIMMEQMMGKAGEEQMHVSMGKRLSGCQSNVQTPPNGVGFTPMMWMMKGGDNLMMGTGFGNMMSDWGGLGIFSWLLMLLFWILVVLGVVVLVRYLYQSGQGKEDRTPLDILKERYARGEINKKEFEEKKKDLI